MNEFSQTVARMYQAELASFGTDGAQMRDVFDRVRPKVRALIEAGELSIDLDGAIDAELVTIDTSNGKQADRVLASLASGQGMFDLGMDAALEVVVTLGGGLRKQWRDITQKDLVLMDTLRFENMRKQQDAYAQWRHSYSPVAAVLISYQTIGDAVAAGAFAESFSDRRSA